MFWVFQLNQMHIWCSGETKAFHRFDKALLPNSSAFSIFFVRPCYNKQNEQKAIIKNLRGKSKCPVLHFQTIRSRKGLMVVRCDAFKRLQDLNWVNTLFHNIHCCPFVTRIQSCFFLKCHSGEKIDPRVFFGMKPHKKSPSDTFVEIEHRACPRMPGAM